MSDPSGAAEAIFESWLVGGEQSFDDLCAAHPALADELRSCRADYERARDLCAQLEFTEEAPVASLERVFEKLMAPRTTNSIEPIAELGRGGMGRVELVRDARLDRELARKVIPIDVRKPLTFWERRQVGRFLDEVRVMGRLQHPSVLPLLEAGVDGDGRPYFTMPVVRGHHFGKVLESARAGDGWSRERSLQVLIAVCETLAHAHERGVVHRDVKPQNIMIGPYGEVYLTDWGLARCDLAEAGSVAGGECDAAGQTMHGDVIGTPWFMSPEQAVGDLQAVGPKSDQYSVGAILYEILVGHAPYSDTSATPREALQSVRDDVPTSLSRHSNRFPAELIAICDRAMARSPRDRYRSVADLAADLRAFTELRVVQAYATGAWSTLRKWIVRNRGLALSVGALLVVGFSSLVVLNVLQTEHRRVLTKSNNDLRWTAYRQQITVAQNTIRAGGFGRDIQDNLEECDASLRAWEWRYLRRLADTSIATAQLARGVQSMAASADGSRVGIATVRRAYVIDAKTLEVIREWPFEGSHGKELRAVACSPDGRYLVVGRTRGNLELLDIATGEVETIQSRLGSWAIRFLPGGERFVVGASTGHVVLYDFATRRPIRTFGGMRDRVASVAASSDGTLVAGGDHFGTVVVWRADTGEELVRSPSPTGAFTVFGLEFRSQESLISCDWRGRVFEIDVRSGRRTRRFRLPRSGFGAAVIDSVSDRLVCVTDSAIDVFTTNGVLRGRCTGLPNVAISALLLPSRADVIAGDSHGVVKRWSLRRGGFPLLPRGAWKQNAWSVAITGDGRRAATLVHSGELAVRELGVRDEDAEWSRIVRTESVGTTPQLVFSPDGRAIAHALREAAVVRDAETLAVTRSIQLEEGLGRGVDWSHDGTTLVVDDRGLVLLDAGTWKKRRLSREPAIACQFGSAGRHVVACLARRRGVACWEVASGRRLWWRPRSGALLDVETNGQRCAISRGHGTIEICDVRTGATRAVLEVSALRLHQARFADGDRIFVVGDDGLVRVWDLERRCQVIAIPVDGGSLTGIDLSAGGNVLIVGGHSPDVRIWRLDDRGPLPK